MSLDIIYLLIGTPVTIAVMYGSHVVRKWMRATNQIQEAKPYQFERDKFVPGFNEAIQHQRAELNRMYRGEALRS